MLISDWSSDVCSSDLEHVYRGAEVAFTQQRVEAAGERARRAHLFHDRLAQFLFAPDVFGHDRLEQVEALLDRELRIAGEGLACGGDRLVDIGGRAERDRTRDFQIGRASCRERVCTYV